MLLLAVVSTSMPNAISQNGPYIEAEKIISPQRVREGENIDVTIRLWGAGDLTQTPVDVILILDRSGSMRGDKIEDAKNGSKVFLNCTDDSDKVGLVSFGSEVEIESDLQFMDTANKEDLEDKIGKLKAEGFTNIYDAIVTANDLLLESPRINAPLVEVLLTDGLHNFPTLLPDNEFELLANEAKDNGIIIYTIGLGDDANVERLQMISNVTGGEFFFAPTSEELKEIFIEIADKLSFAGTNIKVTETVPSYASYNGDASKIPYETSGNGETIIKWDVGHIKMEDEWEVTYTAKASRAIDSSDLVIQTLIEYITNEGVLATIDLKPGLLFNDIAVTSLIAEPNEMIQGEICDITATVESKGIVQETFEVEIRYDSELLNTQTLTLDPDQSKNVTFTWDTSDAEGGKYQITVAADPDEKIWEQDRSDNTVAIEVEITSQAENPMFFLFFMIMLLLLVVPIIAATGYSKFRSRPPSCPICREFLIYDNRIRRWYCQKCKRYIG